MPNCRLRKKPDFSSCFPLIFFLKYIMINIRERHLSKSKNRTLSMSMDVIQETEKLPAPKPQKTNGIKTIIIDEFEIEEELITMNTSLTDELDIDSLDLVDAIVTINDEFGVEVPDDEVENLTLFIDL